MGAEPFFFKQSEGQTPQSVYARVMKFFVITITVMFLVVALYLDIWKYFLLPIREIKYLLDRPESGSHIAFGKYVPGYLLQSFHMV